MGLSYSSSMKVDFFILNTTYLSCLNGLLLIFALEGGWTVFVRVLKHLSGPISDCRSFVCSVLYYFVGNEGPQDSALSDLRFHSN